MVYSKCISVYYKKDSNIISAPAGNNIHPNKPTVPSLLKKVQNQLINR
jgi:hypothetical protein